MRNRLPLRVLIHVGMIPRGARLSRGRQGRARGACGPHPTHCGCTQGGVLKFNEAAGQPVPPLLVALAEK